MSQYGYLAHHGVKGQKWGIRRFQNPDGSLTPEGIERYGIKGIKKNHLSQDSRGNYRLTDKGAKFYNKFNKNDKLNSGDKVDLSKYAESLSKRNKRNAAITATALVAIGGASIGGVALYKHIKNGKNISEDSIENIEYEKLSNMEVDGSESKSSNKEKDNLSKFGVLGGFTYVPKEEAEKTRKMVKEAESKREKRESVKNKYRNEIKDEVNDRIKSIKNNTGYSKSDSDKLEKIRERAKEETNRDRRSKGLEGSLYNEEYKMHENKLINKYIDSDPEAKAAYEREKKYKILTSGLYDKIVDEFLKRMEA